jgi:predicted amidohydrolase
MRVACVQTNSGPEFAANIEDVSVLIRRAKALGASLVALPENVSMLQPDQERLRALAPAEDDHPALAAFAALARELSVWLLIGSLAVRAGGGKLNNRSILLDAHGRTVARYDKIHLFDVELGNGESYRESDAIAPGDAAVVASTPWGGIGLSVCYDLRFPALYRHLARAGAEVLAIPAAFTRTTGIAHWHTLVRARAIENGAFVLAPAQCGTHAEGRRTFGHSLIVDPWGEVLADGGEDVGVVVADLDLSAAARARTRIPALHHERPFT